MGIDPERLATTLDVLRELDHLPVDHPHATVVRQATGRLFKQVKERRRRERRDAELAHDAQITAATATGAPGRVDDETRGLPLTAGATTVRVGTLVKPRACYTCKQRYVDVDAFYHQLCPQCAELNWSRRAARTDLTGRRALLTGGRAKIGLRSVSIVVPVRWAISAGANQACSSLVMSEVMGQANNLERTPGQGRRAFLA